MEIKGKVIQILPIQEGVSKNNKSWKKATIVIEYGDQYPKKIALDNLKNAEEFAKLAVGTEGVFYIEVESREFNNRWYTSVNCWKWEVATLTQQPSHAPANAPYAAMGVPQREAQTPKDDIGDPLPF